MPAGVNYPDVLGAITDNARLNIGVVQAAVALRPAVVAAGHPFEVVLLLQSASDVPVSVSARLILPAADAKRQKNRFSTAVDRLAFHLAPAEVGCVIFPAHCHADTAPADSYHCIIEIEAKTQEKPNRIRLPEGGGAFLITDLLPAAAERVQALYALGFSAGKAGSNVVECVFSVAAQAGGAAVALQPSYISLCKLNDFVDERWLLHRYGTLMQLRVLPAFKRVGTMPPLMETTRARFQAAGYPLQAAELTLIAKVLALILEFATPEVTGHGYMSAGRYAVQPLLAQDPLTRDDSPPLPRWAKAMLRLIARDERAAAAPMVAITRALFNDLLRDALEYAFEQVYIAVGDELGSPDEMAAYADDVVARLSAGSGMDFEHTYLPLVMCAVLINDHLLMERENPADRLKDISVELEQRWRELRGDDEVEVDDPIPSPVVEMTAELIERTGQKYGYRLGWYDR